MKFVHCRTQDMDFFKELSATEIVNLCLQMGLLFSIFLDTPNGYQIITDTGNCYIEECDPVTATGDYADFAKLDYGVTLLEQKIIHDFNPCKKDIVYVDCKDGVVSRLLNRYEPYFPPRHQAHYYKISFYRQMCEVGGEVARGIKHKTAGRENFVKPHIDLAIKLLAMIYDDPKNQDHPENHAEIAYNIMLLKDFFYGENELESTQDSLKQYYDSFMEKKYQKSKKILIDIRDIKVFPKTREKQETMIKDALKVCADPSQLGDLDETIRKARIRNEENRQKEVEK